MENLFVLRLRTHTLVIKEHVRWYDVKNRYAQNICWNIFKSTTFEWREQVEENDFTDNERQVMQKFLKTSSLNAHYFLIQKGI